MDTLIYLLLAGFFIFVIIVAAKKAKKSAELTYFDIEYRKVYDARTPNSVLIETRFLSSWGWKAEHYCTSQEAADSWIKMDQERRRRWAKERIESRENKRIEYY